MTTIQEYYKLKETQEKQLKRLKNSIFSKTDSFKERRELFKKKFKCFNCKKPGGIKFYSTEDSLFAECNASTKCDFKMSVKKDHSKFIPHLKLYEKINNLKHILIELKTKNLFRYLDEETTIESMEEVINHLEETNLIYKKINKPDDDRELKRLEETLFQIINEMKEKSSIEHIEIYVTILKETLEKIRELKYNSIEKTTVNYNDTGDGIYDASIFNKVIFSKQDLTHHILDIKSI